MAGPDTLRCATENPSFVQVSIAVHKVIKHCSEDGGLQTGSYLGSGGNFLPPVKRRPCGWIGVPGQVSCVVQRLQVLSIAIASPYNVTSFNNTD